MGMETGGVEGGGRGPSGVLKGTGLEGRRRGQTGDRDRRAQSDRRPREGKTGKTWDRGRDPTPRHSCDGSRPPTTLQPTLHSDTTADKTPTTVVIAPSTNSTQIEENMSVPGEGKEAPSSWDYAPPRTSTGLTFGRRGSKEGLRFTSTRRFSTGHPISVFTTSSEGPSTDFCSTESTLKTLPGKRRDMKRSKEGGQDTRTTDLVVVGGTWYLTETPICGTHLLLLVLSVLDPGTPVAPRRWSGS